MGFKLSVAGKSDIGKRRSNNQDSFLVNEKLSLFAIADGMGGHSGGEVASAMAVRTLEKLYSEIKNSYIPFKLHQAIQLSNRAIYDHAQKDPRLGGMGTTLTTVAFDGSWAHLAQVGDSRCYVYNSGELFQITEDHSQVYELIKAGLISDTHSSAFQKNVITRSVGYESQVQIDLFTRRVQAGDRYLICSDGLSGMISNEQIAQILQNFDLEPAVNNLVDLANLQGGEDNISVIVIDVR